MVHVESLYLLRQRTVSLSGDYRRYPKRTCINERPVQRIALVPDANGTPTRRINATNHACAERTLPRQAAEEFDKPRMT
jgi:hypothetical protein